MTISFIVFSCINVIFSICGSIFSIICTVLGNMSKRSLIASVTIVHGLDNQKGVYFLLFSHQRLISTH